ncbi:MAG: amidophosphoribosyltransferase [Candidatus Thorarchaeota archaeon]|nr:amidophosphoribosyltransferase [Candidatus Thorarchaeota archaeon]
MCGVLGIMGGYNLREARELLLLLTHRGQDASGLLWQTHGVMSSAKAMGSPAEIDVPEGQADIVLGSTRYPTSGRQVVSEAELDTFVGPFPKGDIAVTHNGNITNVQVHSRKRYDCDAEFIADMLQLKMQETGNSLPEAFRRLDTDFDGAYSLVGLHGDNLFAYRDPRGFKPLVFGRNATHTVIASESIVLDMAGLTLERDVYPGELIIFRPDGSMESHSISQSSTHSHCFFEYVYFANPASRMESQLVYDVRFRLGRALARLFKRRGFPDPDYVVPVPDTSRPAAQALAEELKVPMREIILKNRYLGRTFIARSQKDRDAMARHKYLYLEDKIRGRDLLVVDDSIVRGTTAKMIVADLRKRGARKVYFAVTCPPQNHPCYYGIDISTSRELIASEKDLEKIREFIDADAVIYQDMDSLVNAIGMRDNCLACLDGRYPTEHARWIRQVAAQSGESCTGRDYERIVG